jgi:hypothetical protein
MPPEVGAVPSKDSQDDRNVDADGGSFDAFLSYISGEEGAPPPSSFPSPPHDDPKGYDASDIEVASSIDDGNGIPLPAKKKDNAMDDDDVPVPATNAADDIVPPARVRYPPSMFTNDRGNLKAVAFVVRRPCLVFAIIVVICIAMTFLLQVMVFRTAEGSPFTPPTNEFNLKDVRSVQYDSYRLARDEVQSSRKSNEVGDMIVPRQSEVAAIAMWVFESEEVGDKDPNNDLSGRGVFGSAESISAMKEAYDIFIADPAFKSQCLLDYRTWTTGGGGGASSDPADDGANATTAAGEEEEEEERKCIPPLSPLSMYYASEWDTEMVTAVIDELKDPTRLEMFNSLALCFARGQYCEQVIDDVSPEDAIWASMLASNITSISSKFDMGGELVEDYDQVTELASYLIKVDVFKGFVDYGYDLDFSSENPVSR